MFFISKVSLLYSWELRILIFQFIFFNKFLPTAFRVLQEAINGDAVDQLLRIIETGLEKAQLRFTRLFTRVIKRLARIHSKADIPDGIEKVSLDSCCSLPYIKAFNLSTFYI